MNIPKKLAPSEIFQQTAIFHYKLTNAILNDDRFCPDSDPNEDLLDEQFIQNLIISLSTLSNYILFNNNEALSLTETVDLYFSACTKHQDEQPLAEHSRHRTNNPLFDELFAHFTHRENYNDFAACEDDALITFFLFKNIVSLKNSRSQDDTKTLLLSMFPVIARIKSAIHECTQNKNDDFIVDYDHYTQSIANEIRQSNNNTSAIIQAIIKNATDKNLKLINSEHPMNTNNPLTPIQLLESTIAATVNKGLVVSLNEYDARDGINDNDEFLETPNSLFYMMQDVFSPQDIDDQTIMSCLVQQLPSSLQCAIL
jgi:hypothetical protein